MNTIRPNPRPRSTNEGVVTSSRVDKMIANYGKIKETEHVMQPIADIETYIFMAGLKGAEADAMRALHPPPPPMAVKAARKWNVPSDPDYVKVNIKVCKDGTTKVNIVCPLEPLKPYYKKGRMPPLGLRLVAAKGFGYPDHILKSMIARHDWWKRNSDKLDAFIESIYGKK